MYSKENRLNANKVRFGKGPFVVAHHVSKEDIDLKEKNVIETHLNISLGMLGESDVGVSLVDVDLSPSEGDKAMDRDAEKHCTKTLNSKVNFTHVLEPRIPVLKRGWSSHHKIVYPYPIMIVMDVLYVIVYPYPIMIVMDVLCEGNQGDTLNEKSMWDSIGDNFRMFGMRFRKS